MIQERDRLYRRFRRTRLPLNRLAYRQARDVAHRTIEEARLNYHHTWLSSLTDAKDVWRELEHLGISGSKKSRPPFLSPLLSLMLITGVSHSIKTLHLS